MVPGGVLAFYDNHVQLSLDLVKYKQNLWERDFMENENLMALSLHVKVPSSFYWLRKIRKVRIDKCCVGCFYAETEKEMYHRTRGKQYPLTVDMDIKPEERYVAYYLCGLSRGYVHANNTHIAFVHAPGETLHVDSPQMTVTITNARHVDFEGSGYIPNPPGEYTNEQRTCRNWIFANYVKEGKLDEVK